MNIPLELRIQNPSNFRLNLLKFWQIAKAYHLIILLLAIYVVLFWGLGGFNILKNSWAHIVSAREIDLLVSMDWSHFAGADLQSDGLHISPLGREIVNQDGSPGQDNPPINTYGPHISAAGNFQINADLNNAKDGAALQFYGSLPTIYDEWRLEPASLKISTNNDNIKVSVGNGKDDDPIEAKAFNADLGNGNFNLKIEKNHDWLTFKINDQKVGSMRDHGIFASKNIWVGADNNGDNPWLISALHIRPLSSGHVGLIDGLILEIPHSSKNLLRNLATKKRQDFKIGAAVANNPLMADKKYRNLAGSQFNLLTLENDLKPQFVHPQPEVYDFTEADNIVEFAKHNGIMIHGHTLVFGEANPAWMQNAPQDQLQKIMQDHIAKVVGNFKGDVASWDVVNEPLSDNADDYKNGGTGLRNHLWMRAMGEDYIDLALRAAHKSDPKAKLFINEYGIEQDGDRWDALLSLLERLKDRSVPINGVGFQAHIHERHDSIDDDIFRKHIKTLADMGLESRISEIDVHGEDQSQQASEYAKALDVCLSQTSCKSFTTWGITDKYGSTTDHTYPPKYGNDLIWDANFKPKPALKAIQSVLK